MNYNQYYSEPYETIPYNDDNQYETVPVEGGEERFLPLLAGLAITAPFWAGGWGRRCCGGFGGGFPVPYPLPYPFPFPYTFNTYQGVVGSPYSFYNGRPYVY